MENLIVFLFMAAFIMFIIGLFAPKITVFWTTKKTRKKSAMTYGILSFLFLLTAIPFTEQEQEQEQQKIVEKEAVKIDTLKRLFSGLDDLQNRFNSFSESIKSDFKITDLPSIIKGDVNNVATYFFNPNISLLSTLNKQDNSISSITLLGRGDGTASSGANLIIVLGSLIGAADNSLSNADRNEINTNLGLLSEDFKVGHSKKYIKNNISYYVSLDETIGLMFSISKL